MISHQAIAYVRDNRLCIWGVSESGLGPIPFSYSVPVENQPDGPVDMNEPNEAIKAALEQSEKPIMRDVQKETLTRAASDLVERARMGDQNAMGMLAMVAENARRGIKRAVLTKKLVERYIAQHPMIKSDIGSELLEAPKSLAVVRKAYDAIQTEDMMQYASAVIGVLASIAQTDTNCVAVTLANGPDLYEGTPNHRISSIHDMLKDEGQQTAFTIGVKNQGTLEDISKAAGGLTPELSRAFYLGKAVNLGRKIQGVRRPEVPIATLSPMAAWELGE